MSPSLTPEQLRALPTGMVEGHRVVFIGDEIYRIDGLYRASDQAVLEGYGVGQRWPGGRVPIAFATNVDATEQSKFMAACAAWNPAGISCVARTNEGNYLVITEHSGDQCGGPYISCSWHGMQGGRQSLFIYSTHWDSGHVITHEIGHALGLAHEQKRDDRGNYVLYYPANATDSSGPQFAPMPGTRLSAYDIDSIMHYQACTFAKFGDCGSNPAHRVLEPKPCARAAIGDGMQVSSLDIAAVRNYYGFPALTDTLAARPVFETAIPCGPSCRLVGGVYYGRVNSIERQFYIPGAPNPLPTVDQLCRGQGQRGLPQTGMVTPAAEDPPKTEIVVIIRGECGCPNAVP